MVAEHGTAIKITTITLDATVTLTTSNICQLKTMPYLCILKFVWLPIIVEVVLKEPIS